MFSFLESYVKHKMDLPLIFDHSIHFQQKKQTFK